MNKIKKASVWNSAIENYNFLKQGMDEADGLLKELGLDENSSILAFLKMVSEGNATILDLTEEILCWIKSEGLAEKIKLTF